MRKLNAVLLLLAASSVMACGKAQMRGGSDPNLLTNEQIVQSGLTTAWDVVDRLRPQWLHVRAPRSITGGGPTVSGPGATNVVVYIDGVRAGDLSALKAVIASSVESMKFLDASEATSEHGTGHLFGAIEVRTKHGGGD